MVLEKMQEYVTHLSEICSINNVWLECVGTVGTCGKVGVALYMTEHTICARFEMLVGHQ
jgi:hypothetical protein